MPIFLMLGIFERRERPNAGQPRACMDWPGRTHATYFACAFEALAPIVVTIGVEVKILHSESWVGVIDHNVRISITITKGLCMHTDVCQLCLDMLHSARRLLKCRFGDSVHVSLTLHQPTVGPPRTATSFETSAHRN